MSEVIAILAQAVVVAGFFLAAFSYIVLRPLNAAIVELRQMIAEMRRDFKSAEDERHKIDVRLTKVEDSARSAHKRIDQLEKNAVKLPAGDVYVRT